MPDQQSIKKQIGEDILHQFSKSVITLLGTKKKRSATAPRCMWQLDSYDALRSHLNGTSLMYPIHAGSSCGNLKVENTASYWVRILWVDLGYDSWHNSKIAPRCIQLLIDLIDSNHDSWLANSLTKWCAASIIWRVWEGSVKWQITSSLHACCHCNAFGLCPSEDIKAFHIHVIDGEPVPFLQAPRTNTNSGMNGFELCV